VENGEMPFALRQVQESVIARYISSFPGSQFWLLSPSG
jgi:hypothetical protein